MKRRPQSRLVVFVLASAALIGAVVVASGLVVGRFFERQALTHEEEHTAAIVLSQAAQHLTASDITLGVADDPRSRRFKEFLEGLPGVFRVKVFDRTGMIVWSNEPRLIGRTFADNHYVARALRGEVATVLEPPTRSEHVYERGRGYVAETYLPVVSPESSEVIAVIEAYKDATALIAGIRRTQRIIWGFTGSTGVFLYVALTFVVWKASRDERRAMKRVEAQNLELALVQRFTHDLLRSLEGGGVLPAGEPVDARQLVESVVKRAGTGLGLRLVALYRIGAENEPTLLAAWPESVSPASIPKLTVDALDAGREIIRGRAVAFPIVTPKGTPHLFLAEFAHPISEADLAVIRILEIMLKEAAIGLGHIELFTEIREAHERLAAILSGITDQIVIVDRTMGIVWMNAAASAAGEREVGRRCFEAIGVAPEVCESCPAVRTMHSGAVERGVRAQKRRDGQTRYLDLVTAPLRDATGQVHQVLEVARDITELVEMETRLKETNQALLDAQAQLVEKERLAAVGEVVVGLHHAILNPLTGVLGALQVLKDEGVGAPERARAVVDAEVEIRKIERLIKRLPDLRRAGGTPYVGKTTMLDFERSYEDDDAASASGRDSG